MEADRAPLERQGVRNERAFERDFGRPVLILTVGRSGSSLVANIFAEHGLWIGKTRPGDRFNPHGYFENSEIKGWIKPFYGFDVSGPMPETKPGWRDIVRGIVEGQGYAGGPWGLKTGAHYANVWGEFDPVFIKVMRDRDAIERSYREYGGVYPDHGPGFIDRGLETLRRLPGFEVDTDDLIAGRRFQIREALEGVELGYDAATIDRIVRPEFWHGG